MGIAGAGFGVLHATQLIGHAACLLYSLQGHIQWELNLSLLNILIKSRIVIVILPSFKLVSFSEKVSAIWDRLFLLLKGINFISKSI